MKFTPLAILAAIVAVAAEARLFGGAGGAIQRASGSNSVHRLHEILNIGKDPTEAIWTNRLLNMEGF